MRLEGRVKAGFFAAPHEALDVALPLLQPPDGQPWALLDPCCGEGEAVGFLADKLGCPPSSVYAIELEEHRAEKARGRLAGGNVLGPCSFFGSRVGMHTCSMVYLNPPFDDSGDGSGRVEQQFLDRATSLLKKDGVLMMVCPEAVSNKWTVRRSLLAYFNRIHVMPFPEEHRSYNEVIILAVKRAHMADPDKREREDDPEGWLPGNWRRESREPGIYVIPPGSGPQQRFVKTALTDQELFHALDHSPLRALLEAPSDPPLPSPPLELGTGHLALLLAAGQLDGLVEPEGEPSHVVRGTVRKVEQVSEVTTEETETSTRTTTVLTESIEMYVRVVGVDGVIKDFTQTKQEATA